MDQIRDSYFKTPKYTRGRVCKVMGISKDALRYYEENGLVSPWINPKNKYKYYSITDLEILDVILFMRSIDINVYDIPKVMQCKDIYTYKKFLKNHYQHIEEKISYFNSVSKILHYLDSTISAYEDNPDEEKIVKNTVFNFQVTEFSYECDVIENMVPKIKSNNIPYHIIKLKIVGSKWINSDRQDESDLTTGHLCDANTTSTEYTHINLASALNFNTFCELKDIPGIIQSKKAKYANQYTFDEKAYIIEHICVNIYNQDALLRSIYLPIKEYK